MAFSYDFNTNPAVAYIRLLLPDTTEDPAKNLPIFQDNEIERLYTVQQMQFQSSMFFSPPAGRILPATPVSLLRVAALGLDIIANNAAFTSLVTQLMDIKLSAKDASAMIAARANQYRQTDDEAGAFAIVEQCFTGWGFQDRYWNQIARMQGGGSIA